VPLPPDVPEPSAPQDTATAQVPAVPAVSAGLSPGAGAGIGVGSAIAGAIFGALLLWLLSRKKSRQPHHDDPVYEQLSSPRSTDKAPFVSSMTMHEQRTTAAAIVEKSLPQPLADKDITDDMSKLRTSIKSHVENLYHMEANNAVPHKQLVLQQLGMSDVEAARFASLLSQPAARAAALRALIATTVFQRIEHRGNPELTLLPPEVVSCLHSMSEVGDSHGRYLKGQDICGYG